MRKKLLAVLLATTCIAGCMTGCGSDKAAGEGETGKTTETSSEELFDEDGKYLDEITITGVLSHSQPQEDYYPSDISPESFSYIQAAKDKLNINFEWLWTAPSEQFEQKFGVAMASGNLPDIMKVSSVDYETLKENGQLADLSGTLQYANDIMDEYLNADPSVLESMKTEDGKLYAIPQYFDTRREMNMLYIRQDWLDELGLSVPTTVDELETVMEAFQKKTGADQAIALSGNNVSDWGLDVKGIMNMFGAAPTAWLDDGDGNLVAGEVQPEVKTALETMADWYQKGYINKEFVSMDVNKAEESVISGDTGILLGPWWMSESVVNLCTQKNQEARWSMAAIPSNGDGKAIVPRRSISAYFVVNADCEHPEALIKLMNMVATGSVDQEEWTKPQNGYVWNWCPTLYTDPYDIERVYEHFTDAMEADPEAEGEAPADFTETEKTYWEAMPAYNAFWENGDTTILEDEVAFMSFGNILARIDHNGGWATAIKVADSGDLMYNEYYGPATDTQKEVSATLTKLMNENYLKIIMGEQSIDTFDKFTEDWMALGGEDITKEVNEWYQENK